MKIKKVQNNKAFTLVELMVATSIFVIIMLASMGSLFTLLDASKSSRALRFAMDNVNFAMESMSRSIRMGTNYYCVETESTISLTSYLDTGKNCTSGGTTISFLPQNVSTYRVGYKLTNLDPQDPYKNTLERCEVIGGCVPIISPDVNIEQVRFFVKGSETADGQASVYIIMKGTAYVKGVPTSFAIQTLASQRNF